MTALCSPVAAAEGLLLSHYRALDVETLTPAAATSEFKELERVRRLVTATQIRIVRRIDESVTGDDSEGGKARWLAMRTGQSTRDASRDIAASEALAALAETDRAMRNGELSAAQAHEVTSAAVLNPSAEGELLHLAREGSLAELRRAARKVRAAATDNEKKAKDAHANRDVAAGSDEETGEGWFHGHGPTTAVAELLAHLEPWIQAEFDKARREGRRERRGALMFDALLNALCFAAACRRGHLTGKGPLPDGPASWPYGAARPDGPDVPVTWPSGPSVNILVRVDLTTILRGHAIAGETCEIDGLGPVPLAALREWFPQAAIDLIITKGVDVFNVTHFGRRANARQQVVLDWLGEQCSRLGCGATRNLQIDHRVEWSKIHITELANLDKLCIPDHNRKTREGWALVTGTGRRRMVPPDHPDHPANAPPANAPPAAGDPPAAHAA